MFRRQERLSSEYRDGARTLSRKVLITNLRLFAIAISASQRGDRQTLDSLIYPDINAGLEGVRWIENCVRSADNVATGLTTNKEITMRLSFCTDSLGYLPFEQMLDRLLELGVHGVEMTTGDGLPPRICRPTNC